MISGTITDASGRTLSGQTTEAFWNSLRHAKPLTFGLNCALGPDELRQYVAGAVAHRGNLRHRAPERRPAERLRRVRSGCRPRWRARSGSGRRPASSISSAAAAAPRRNTSPRSPTRSKDVPPRRLPEIPVACRLSGLEPLTIDANTLFVNVGERTNVTGSARFKRLIKEEKYSEALDVARQQVESGAQVIDINMDEGMLDSEAAMVRFLNLIASEPDIARVPIMIDSSKWEVIEAGLKCIQGKGIVNSISMKEGEEAFIHHANLVRRYGAAVVVMAFDEVGQADTRERKIEICRRAYNILIERSRLPAGRHHLRPEHLRRRHRHRGAQQLRGRLHRGLRRYQNPPAARDDLRRRVQRVVLVPRQRPGARGDPRGVPLPRHPQRHGHGHRQRRPAGDLRRAADRAARGASRT